MIHSAPFQAEGPATLRARAIAALVPRIETARLVLRAPRLDDYPAYEAVFTTDRARFIGGPFTPEQAFADFCQGVAGWLLRGSGMWTLALPGAEDRPIGWIYLWQEHGDPEPELGWVLTAAAEGRGYAAEGARAVLPLALAQFGAGGFVSYIDAGNDRSARLALALGAQRDPAAEADLAASGETGLHVYRHGASAGAK